MAAAAFDTLKIVQTLRDKAHFSPEQAEGIAEAMQGDLATKADVKETELRLQAEIERSKADLIRWMFGAMGFQAIILIGAAVVIVRMFTK